MLRRAEGPSRSRSALLRMRGWGGYFFFQSAQFTSPDFGTNSSTV
jgi:hypothetical protein